MFMPVTEPKWEKAMRRIYAVGRDAICAVLCQELSNEKAWPLWSVRRQVLNHDGAGRKPSQTILGTSAEIVRSNYPHWNVFPALTFVSGRGAFV
jgi:hypothetical protein